jgi:SSS family solute:Na+ symporter
MTFTTLDWTIISISIAVSFLPALFFYKRAGSSTTEFFTS